MKNIQPGDYVVWKWAGNMVEGEVIAVTPERVSIESRGKLIVRNGTPENPAVTLQHASGSVVLKLASELTKAS